MARIVKAAQASPHIPKTVLDQAEADCETALCFAETLAKHLPDLARIEAVDHPDTDSIRWVSTLPSVTANVKGERLHLELGHFGRKAVGELRQALAGSSLPIELDLRGNAGGDFERMLRIAGALIGTQHSAVKIDYWDRSELRDLSGTGDQASEIIRVLIDEDTASAALLLARLLETFADAEIVGLPLQKTPIFLKRRVTIDHDWRLVLPVATLRVAQP